MIKAHIAYDIDLETLNNRSRNITFCTIKDSQIVELVDSNWSKTICGKPIKASIRQWHLIGIKTKEFNECVLVGFKDGYECRVTTTTFVQAVAPDHSALLTENSIYALHDKGDGDPTPEQLTALVHTINMWIGERT